MSLDNIKIESKFLAYKAELEGSVTNRRREVIASELHKLSSMLSENDKVERAKLIENHKVELSEIKSDYDGQIITLIDQLKAAKKETDKLTEEKRLNKLKAQNIFKKLNARLTPDEMKLFSDGLDFIRIFVK